MDIREENDLIFKVEYHTNSKALKKITIRYFIKNDFNKIYPVILRELEYLFFRGLFVLKIIIFIKDEEGNFSKIEQFDLKTYDKKTINNYNN